MLLISVFYCFRVYPKSGFPCYRFWIAKKTAPKKKFILTLVVTNFCVIVKVNARWLIGDTSEYLGMSLFNNKFLFIFTCSEARVLNVLCAIIF